MPAYTIPAWTERHDGSLFKVNAPFWEQVLVGGDDDKDYYVSLFGDPGKVKTVVRVESYNGGSSYELECTIEIRTSLIINANDSGWKSLFALLKAYLKKAGVPILRWAE